MTFAKCIGGEPDRDFGSPMSREMLPSRLKMRQLLGWTKGSNNRSESESRSQQQIQQNSLDSRQSQQSPATDVKQTLSTPSAVPYKKTVSVETNNLEDLSLDDTKDDKPEQENDLENLGAKHGKPLSTSPSPELAPPPPPSVVYRKGEKSFLDFHQQYAITRHLGEGSYSTVKQVTHRKKGGFYACKIVDKASLSAVDRAALSQEVHVLSQISHNNIMRLHEVIEDDTKCYLVTELAEHGDLFDRIVKQGKFPQREAQKVVAALTEALYYCHSKNIIHRDIKPENVLLSGDNVKLCDFGFAKELSHSREQSVDSCGTPGYAAPEILDGKPYGIEVDVFSLGVVMYIMICGYPPFPMKLAQLRNHRFNVRFPSKDWAHVESSVKELLIKMLHITPSHRPSAAYLRAHPWIRKGKETLDQLRREAEERKRLADLTRKQQTADAIRKKLVMGGFEVVKYGRNGLPHRTKLRLSNDGKSITWQPKLFKRGLLRYQNARSITSLFGITKDNNGSSHPQLHVPQVNRLSSCEVVSGGKHSEPSLDDDGDADRRKSTLSSTGSNSSNNSSTSDSNSTNEKKLWWMSFRRDRGKAERTASGGFSLSFTTRSSASSFEGSSISSPPDRASSAAVPVTPLPDKLDDSVHLSDIRAMLMGDQSEFFTAHKFNLPYGCKRAVDPGCVLSVATRFRELHLEFQNEEIRDGFAYLLEQVTLPLQKTVAEEKSRYANVSRVSSSEKDDEMDETMEFEDANQFAHECVQDGREHNNNNESE